jgi:hypothetical protein
MPCLVGRVEDKAESLDRPTLKKALKGKKREKETMKLSAVY